MPGSVTTINKNNALTYFLRNHNYYLNAGNHTTLLL